MIGAVMSMRANLGGVRRLRIPGGVIHLALALFVVGWSVHVTRDCIWTTNNYGSGDIPSSASRFDFMLKVAGLAERSAAIQAAAGGPVTYAWGQGSAAGVRSIRAGGGVYPIETGSASAAFNGRVGKAGIVENGTGAVVLAVTGLTPGWCSMVLRMMSPYSLEHASYAWLPGAVGEDYPSADMIDRAVWNKADGSELTCAGKGKDHDRGTALYRFDARLAVTPRQ